MKKNVIVGTIVKNKITFTNKLYYINKLYFKNSVFYNHNTDIHKHAWY